LKKYFERKNEKLAMGKKNEKQKKTFKANIGLLLTVSDSEFGFLLADSDSECGSLLADFDSEFNFLLADSDSEFGFLLAYSDSNDTEYTSHCLAELMRL